MGTLARELEAGDDPEAMLAAIVAAAVDIALGVELVALVVLSLVE